MGVSELKPPVLYFLVGLAGLLFTAAAGHALLTLGFFLPSLSPVQAAALMVVTLLALLLELKPTRLAFGREVSEIVLSSAIYLPVLLLVGWPFAVLLAALSNLGSDIYLGKQWYKALYNAANGAFSLWLAGNLYVLLAASVSTQPPLSSPEGLLAALGAGLLYATANAMLVALPIALAQGLSYRLVLTSYAKGVVPFFAGITSVSVAVAAMWQVHPFSTLLLLPALLTAKLAYDNYVRLRVETDNFVHALADAVDLRDPYTARHSARVAELSQALGERLGLPPELLWGLKAVARVHDVGKVTVPDSVLLKAGPLSPEEYEAIKGHVEAGVRILQNISLYRDALDILAQHHERLDGSGYPQGLKGDEIILPARILAVADAYDAMTTDRPYRPGKTPEEAVQELYRVAGKEYDLDVVRALEDELIARRVLKGPVIPAALEAVSPAQPREQMHAAPRAARVVPLPRVGSGRKPS